ncbi:MAG: UV DNA damage repair endonuclease UvsE [Deltaproteobacteria bacterium]|nr:UV DNA damage repair endonuclease UvsE [Deltaproteobacteria bacterium]
MKFGLCCLFSGEPIAYKTYSFLYLQKLEQKESGGFVREKVLSVWKHNREMLQKAFDYCDKNGISGYRIGSDFYAQVPRLLSNGYIFESDLQEAYTQLSALNTRGLILSMHPGQHVNLGSPTSSVVDNSLEDLDGHFAIAGALNFNEVNIHLGGAYGDKDAAIKRFIDVVSSIPKEKQKLITLENDELNYSIDEVISVAKKLNLRVVYDIHHQRCHELKYKSKGTIRYYFERARETWPVDQIQRVHISSPRDGYTTISKSRPHADYINQSDIPNWLWKENVLVDIEAKAKEQAILKLQKI